MTYKKAIQQGFTLIETLMAVLILAIALAAPLTIASKALGSALIAKDQTIASFLAQDAVEYLRYKRDGNTLRGDDWMTGFAACTGADGCAVDSFQNTIVSCPTGGCNATGNVLYYDSTQHFYTISKTVGTDTMEPSIFTRTTTITDVANNLNEKMISVTVSWKDVGGVTRSLVVHEDLLKWQ